MKAWIAEDKYREYGIEIIFANTRGQAIAEALKRDCFEDLNWIDIRVHRFKELDGKEQKK